MKNLPKKFNALLVISTLALGAIVLSPTIVQALPNQSCNVAVFADGDGTENSPYLVEDGADFAEVIDCGGNMWHFKQTANIGLGGTWGNTFTFNGVYDGDGFSIVGIYIDGSEGQGSRGLFGDLVSAYVGNLTLDGQIINARTSSGLLAGRIYSSTVSSVTAYVSIDIDASRDSAVFNVGGLIGEANDDSAIGGIGVFYRNQGDSIKADDVVGGVVGISTDSSVYNSNSYVDVVAVGDGTYLGHSGYAGGIVGYANLSGNEDFVGRTFWISYVNSSGNVTCDDLATNCGGVVGTSTFPIRNSSASGDIYGGQRIGGLAGYTRASVIDSYATGAVTAVSGYAGGLIGYTYNFAEELEVARSFAAGNVNAAQYAGGLIGLVGLVDSPSFEITNTYALGSVESNNAAGLVADMLGSQANSVNVSNSYFGGTLPRGGDAISGVQLSSTIELSFSNILWNKGANSLTSQRADATNGVYKTELARLATFSDPSWNLDDVWKLDRDFQSGLLSLRGVGTSVQNLNPVPACTKAVLKPVVFKKNSFKFTNATREVMRQNALKIINSYCSSVLVSGYTSKDEPKKKQKSLAKKRAEVVANFINAQLEQNGIYLAVNSSGKGVIKKGKAAKNRKASAVLVN